MLIVFGGLPGVGETMIARELARQVGAVQVRVDSIEQAIRDSGTLSQPGAGYRVDYAIAEDSDDGRIVSWDRQGMLPSTEAIDGCKPRSSVLTKS